ncbi:MAG: cation diffusion facilitator family transporter [Deinococcaceae bacterium]
MSADVLNRAAALSLWISVLVFGLKLLGYSLTHSVGILSDALESTVNIAASILLALSLRVATQPEDANHPYGHHKAEYVSSFVEGLFVGGAGMLIISSAISRWMSPVPLDADPLGLGVTVLASLINGVLALHLMRLSKRHHSIALEADGQHLLSDVYSSAAALLGVGLAFVTGWEKLDALTALAVAVALLFTSYRIVQRSLSGLMDEALSPSKQEELRSIIEGFSAEMIEYHALRSRTAGHRTFIDFHLILPAETSLETAHALCDRIEEAIDLVFVGSNTTIHVETEAFAERCK